MINVIERQGLWGMVVLLTLLDGELIDTYILAGYIMVLRTLYLR